MEFFQAVARVMTAVVLGQASLRACFHDPDGFATGSYLNNGVRRPIEACYRLLF